jgi:hypothetical protein
LAKRRVSDDFYLGTGLSRRGLQRTVFDGGRQQGAWRQREDKIIKRASTRSHNVSELPLKKKRVGVRIFDFIR